MFHWKNGWYFGRIPDTRGDVIIRNDNFGGFSMIIDADSWASIVASVSKTGETAESWKEVNELHISEDRRHR